MRFEDAVEFVLSAEGTYSNDPLDPGGETRYGISKQAYPQLNIASLTREQAIEIYKRDYWDRCQCDTLPSMIRLPVFDCAVNQGVIVAAKILQSLVGVERDGVIGPHTLFAIQKHKLMALKIAFLVERILLYTKNPQFSTFGRGWLHRVFRISGV